MGASDDLKYPHLRRERDLLAETVTRGKPLLGVCLGAQLLAQGIGAEVSRGPELELGFGEVHLTEAGMADPVLGSEGPRVPVFHWHHDTFALPSGAVQLAASPLYEQQAFRIGEVAYGLQFHIELDDDAIDTIRPVLPAAFTIDNQVQARAFQAGRRILSNWWSLIKG
jgi:GMP synthase (glutamine-hydrolysing)